MERFPPRESVDEVERPQRLVVRHHVPGVPHENHGQVADVLRVPRKLIGYVPLCAAFLLEGGTCNLATLPLSRLQK